ncbi:MAG: hypothetical protein SPL55_00490 [Prevotella sp.]|nr:hypothetical protein [Prevotella sp.]
MKRRLLVCCLTFLTTQLFAVDVGDSLVQPSKKEFFVLKLNGGVSLLTSRVEVGDNTYSFQPGMEYMLECERLEESENGVGKGWGLVFKGNRTYVGGDYKMNLYHFGINRIWWNSFGKNNRWRWEAAVGGGACLYVNDTNWESYGYYRTYLNQSTSIGIGILLKAGCEYRITNHFGLGLEMNDFLHIFFDDAMKTQREKTLLTGFATTSLTLGLRFYL